MQKPETRKLYLGSNQLSIADLLSLVQHNQVMGPTVELCVNEFMSFISEMQICSYNGAARTLRCILETALEACEYQMGAETANFDNLLMAHKDLIKYKKKERTLCRLSAKYNAWACFMERYRIFEKINRIAPSFAELVNSLKSRQFFNEVPIVSDDIKGTYETLSDYVHPALWKFEKATAKKYKLYQLEFDRNEFDRIYGIGLKTLDIVEFLYFRSIAIFFGFKHTRDFLKDLAVGMEITAERDPHFLKQPYFQTISKDITFRVVSGHNSKSRKPKCAMSKNKNALEGESSPTI